MSTPNPGLLQDRDPADTGSDSGGFLLSDWFERGLRLSPESAALRIAERTWTYTELRGEAVRLAGALGVAGDARGRRVGVLATRSIECYAGILAACYAGAVVVPLSPAFPVSRTRTMIEAASVTSVIVDRHGADAAVALAAELPDLRVLAPDPGVDVPGAARCPVSETEAVTGPARVRVDPAQPAYILFTSGSTGTPKGVPITHANMAHFIETSQRRYDLTPADVFSQTFDSTFDLVMFDLFMAWSSGATLVSTPPQVFANLPEFVARNGITVWFSVPSAISLVRRRKAQPGAFPSLRWSLFCGEPLLDHDARWWQQAAPRSLVENLYGPTELTIACSAYRWTDERSPQQCIQGIVPIGSLFRGLRALLLDDHGRPTTDEGELCVAGPQMFPGYLSASDDVGRFVTHDGVRWYRTGDLVRSTDASGFVYLGRLDHQTKIRGYRVELAEIEQHIRALPGVTAAAVVGVRTEGNQRLAAWYTGSADLAERIREHLVYHVPEFMVPYWIWHLAELPLNTNRKVDRAALMAMARDRCVQGPAPR